MSPACLFTRPLWYLFSLHQFLVHRVWKGAERAEFPGAFSTHKDSILVDDTPVAYSNQWHPMAAHVLIQVHITTLDLGTG